MADPGDSVEWDLRVTNNGNGDDRITFTTVGLPEGWNYIDQKASKYKCKSKSKSKYTCARLKINTYPSKNTSKNNTY